MDSRLQKVSLLLELLHPHLKLLLQPQGLAVGCISIAIETAHSRVVQSIFIIPKCTLQVQILVQLIFKLFYVFKSLAKFALKLFRSAFCLNLGLLISFYLFSISSLISILIVYSLVSLLKS